MHRCVHSTERPSVLCLKSPCILYSVQCKRGLYSFAAGGIKSSCSHVHGTKSPVCKCMTPRNPCSPCAHKESIVSRCTSTNFLLILSMVRRVVYTLGRFDLPVHTEGRAARHRRSAYVYAARGHTDGSYLRLTITLPGRQGISESRGLPGKGNERLWGPQRPS